MRWTISVLLILCVFVSDAQVRTNYTSQGKYELSRGRYASAITLLNKAIKQYSVNAEAYFLRGVSKYELDDFLGAETDFTEAVGINPKNYEAFLFRGVSRSRMLKFKEAFEDFNHATTLNEDDQRIYLNRALASLHLERYVDVISDCNRVVELEKADGYTYVIRGEAQSGLEMYRVAIADFERAMELDTADMRPILHRGMARTKLKEYDPAIADFNLAMKMDTANMLPIFHRGIAQMEMGKYPEALADFNVVIERHPNNSVVFLNRAILYSDMKKNQEALTDYNAVVRLNPKNVLGYFNRGNLKFNTKDYDGALTDYDKVIDLFPEFVEAHEHRASIYRMQKKRTSYEQAIQEIEQLKMELSISDADLKYQQHVRLMKLTNLKGDFESVAIGASRIQYQTVDIRLLPIYRFTPFPDVNKNIRLYDGYGKPHYDMGIITLITNKEFTSESIIEAKLNSSINSGRSAIASHFRQGLYLGLLRRYAEANASFEKVLAADPDHVVVYFVRAVLRQVQLSELQKSYSDQAGIMVEGSAPEYLTLIDSMIQEIDSDYRKVIKLDSGMVFAYFNLGHLLASSEKYEEAVEQFGRAIEHSENFIEAYYNRGLIRILLGETPTGCADLSRAGELGMTEAYNVIKRYCE